MDEHQQNTSDDFFYCYGAEKNVETTNNKHIYICGRNYEYSKSVFTCTAQCGEQG